MVTETITAGCQLHNNCFTCPFPDCIEGKHFNPEKVKRIKQASALLRQGLNVTEIAEKLSKDKRTIQRYLNGS